MPAHANRLALEKSPYLLQHAHNPVDWRPWGEEAFATARAGQRPIFFLSIGYSTCHWCHVMERESFEDVKIGAFLNEHFISIKVDREERPDVDKIYMQAVQAMMGGGGGWPLNVFLTPDLNPFYGGTYFPPTPMQGRPGFLQLLERLVELWADNPADLIANANQTARHLAEWVDRKPVAGMEFSSKTLELAARALKAEYEPVYGGFGWASKFPRPSLPAFLLRHGWRHRDQEAVDMVLFTCDKMANGGICDQLGGGFARYSVDEKWLVPHFEKMLYDNAQLVHLYLDAHLAGGGKFLYEETGRDIIRYVLRDMTSPEGGGYTAEDADSEGQEGVFYCWTKSEIEELLEPEVSSLAVRCLGISEEGSFIDHSHPDPLPNLNVLSRAAEPADEFRGGHIYAMDKLFRAREKRIRPRRDDKILTSLNGLMLGALARASAILNDEDFLAPPRRAWLSFAANSGMRNPKLFITAGATANATTPRSSAPMPSATPSLLVALDQFLAPSTRVIVVPGQAAPDPRPLLHAAHSVCHPGRVVMGVSGPVDAFAAYLPAQDQTVLYFCGEDACFPPTNDSAEARTLMAAAHPA